LIISKQEGQKKLESQKKHYEDSIARHLTFIDTLLKDKADLNEKIETLTKQMAVQ
jgi:hypothetical protein